MATFMQSLASNPGGSVYGQPGQMNMGDEMQLVNNLKDREMRDFKNKAAFMADLTLKQERMRNMYDPAKMQAEMSPTGYTPPGMQQGQQGMNTVLAHDPNAITGFQKAELGQREKELGLRGQDIAQRGKLGQEAIDVRSAQEKLNQQKADQMNERRIKEANDKVTAAQQKLELQGQTIENLRAYREAAEERHKAEAAMQEHRYNADRDMRQANFDKTHEETGRRLDALEKAREDALTESTTSKVNPEGTERTTIKRRGSAAKTVQVTGKNGQMYEIPADKENEWNASHAPDTGTEEPSGGGGD